MSRKSLTDISVRNLKPRERYHEVPDASARGLRVAVWPSGAKSYIMRYRRPVSGKTAKLTLPAGISLAAARKLAADAHVALAEGRDPGKAKQAARDVAAVAAANTVQAVCLKYLALHEGKLRSGKRRRSVLERQVFPAWGNRPITSIRRSDIAVLLDRIETQSGPHAADQAKAYLSIIFGWYVGRDDEFISPFTRHIKPRADPTARSRVLSDDELRRVWAAADRGDGPFPALIKFLLLTACRAKEASAMQRSELSGADWLLPAARNKVKRDLLRPLSKQALAIVEAQPVINGSAYVFTSDGRVPFCGFSRAKFHFDKECGVTGWRIHDLRRTARSLMSRAGVHSDHAEHALGHVLTGVRSAYDRYEYADEKKRALEALAGLIERIVYPTDNVLQLRG